MSDLLNGVALLEKWLREHQVDGVHIAFATTKEGYTTSLGAALTADFNSRKLKTTLVIDPEYDDVEFRMATSAEH